MVGIETGLGGRFPLWILIILRTSSENPPVKYYMDVCLVGIIHQVSQKTLFITVSVESENIPIKQIQIQKSSSLHSISQGNKLCQLNYLLLFKCLKPDESDDS